MMPHHRPDELRRRPERAVALVMTLSVLAIVVLLVVGFAVSMRIERVAARNYTYSMTARQLCDAALGDAIVRIRNNTPIMTSTNSYVTSPGLTYHWRSSIPNSEYHFTFTSPLGVSGAVDLNADRSILTSNWVYQVAGDFPLIVGWNNVCSNASNTGAPLIGRFAYWVDDESSKIPINWAKVRTTGVGKPDDFDLSVLPGSYMSTAIASNSWAFATTNGYWTTEQWKMVLGQAGYKEYQAYVTPFSRDDDLSPWGARRIDLNSMTQALVDDPTNSLASPALTNFFGLTSGVPNDFARKYGSNVVKQILANIRDFRLKGTSTDGSAVIATGAQSSYLYEDMGGALDYFTGIPKYYLGLRAGPMLNELGAQVVYWYTGNTCPCADGSTQPELQAKVWVAAELINPYPWAMGNGFQVISRIEKLRLRVNNGGVTFYTGPEGNADFGNNPGTPTSWENWVNPQGETRSAVEATNNLAADVAARSYSVVYLPFYYNVCPSNNNARTATIDEAYLILDKVQLLQNQTDKRSIRDWANGKDLRRDLPVDVGANQFTFTGGKVRLAGAAGAAPDWSTANTKGIAKNDPRVRSFTDWDGPKTSWFRVGWDQSGKPNTFGADNNGVLDVSYYPVNDPGATGIRELLRDWDPYTGAVPTWPSFYMKTSNTDTNYDSVGELGYVHSGLNWRTLMLRVTNGQEWNASHIPDWMVLDLFTVTNVPVRARLNINGKINAGAGSSAVNRTVDPWSVTTGVKDPFGPASDSLMLAYYMLTRGWDPNSTWPARRTALGFPSNFYYFTGELCEVQLMSINMAGTGASTNDAMREARIRTLSNMVTTRGSQFSVWIAAQTIQDMNTNGLYEAATDTILGEARAQAVIERYDSADGVFGQGVDTNAYRVLYFRYYGD